MNTGHSVAESPANGASPERAAVPLAPIVPSPAKAPMARHELWSSIIAGCETNSGEAAAKRDKAVVDWFQWLASQHEVSKSYNILVLFDHTRMARVDADSIYSAVTAFEEKKPILLILHSTGGSAAAAYLIGKLCREHCAGKLVVAVPRQAKSAATLLACAADEIHMGSLSELGPIDPQIDDLPALGLKNSVQHIAELVKTYPASAEMFASYLSRSLNLIHLGYYERVAESAMHYAIRLLSTHAKNLPKTAEEISKYLVYGFKDHGFVIDKGEAANIFGSSTVKTATEEYDLANDLYEELSSIKWAAEIAENDYLMIGGLTKAGRFNKRSK